MRPSDGRSITQRAGIVALSRVEITPCTPIG
ncbi:hypothetical protein FB388_2575 [Pseudonocardia cypriaca]|uniref:Uncharacterized protein n=1 Tax=Pseudonocardia cypriaca TaxID=882449 RepID=A0A543GGH2_9PSEU|nr:hypothetical protein FB388_2575 [Pseudonocardia cypriaca]